MRISTSGRPSVAERATSQLNVVQRAVFERHEITQFDNGTIQVKDGEEILPTAKPTLRRIAAAVGVDIEYDEGKQKNTRQLGAHILKTLLE